MVGGGVVLGVAGEPHLPKASSFWRRNETYEGVTTVTGAFKFAMAVV